MPRRPLTDASEDARRIDDYWIQADTRHFHDGVAPLAEPSPGVTLHLVGTPEQADFEASHMRHSVGYNFDHYAGLGEILSLRQDGIPFVTMLATDGAIVHAVRAGNERITDGDRVILQAVCDARGWAMADNKSLQDGRPSPDYVGGTGGPPGP